MVERAPGLRPGGQAVDARGAAREVIRRMGLDAAVRAVCTETAGAHTVDADGNALQTFSADDEGADGYISEIEILRGDLSQVLYTTPATVSSTSSAIRSPGSPRTRTGSTWPSPAAADGALTW